MCIGASHLFSKEVHHGWSRLYCCRPRWHYVYGSKFGRVEIRTIIIMKIEKMIFNRYQQYLLKNEIGTLFPTSQ
jgi:hypothetical protein